MDQKHNEGYIATKEFEEQVTKEIIKLVENNKEIFHEMFNELLLYGKTDTKKIYEQN